MFGINFSEILLIMAIALIIFGPKQLPKIAHKFGLLIYNFKHYFSLIKQEFYLTTGLHELQQARQELLNSYKSIKNNIVLKQKIEETDLPGLFESPKLYQPELEFDRQPELFD